MILVIMRRSESTQIMTTTEFWKIIEESKSGSESSDEQAKKLEELLLKLPLEEIISFDNIFAGFRYAAYRWNLWGVAYILCGGCGDDSFGDFRAWLIGRGQIYYEDVMKNPESFSQNVREGDSLEGELLIYAARRAYEAKAGRGLPARSLKHPKEPQGESWAEEDLPKLFPEAWKKEGLCG